MTRAGGLTTGTPNHKNKGIIIISLPSSPHTYLLSLVVYTCMNYSYIKLTNTKYSAGELLQNCKMIVKRTAFPAITSNTMEKWGPPCHGEMKRFGKQTILDIIDNTNVTTLIVW